MISVTIQSFRWAQIRWAHTMAKPDNYPRIVTLDSSMRLELNISALAFRNDCYHHFPFYEPL